VAFGLPAGVLAAGPVETTLLLWRAPARFPAVLNPREGIPIKTLFKLPPALFHGLLVDFAYDFWCRLLDEWGELTGLGLIGDLHNCANAGRGA
jgi:hypothetical protein